MKKMNEKRNDKSKSGNVQPISRKANNVKRILIIYSLAAMALQTGLALSAETSVKGTVYSTWMMNGTDGADNYNAFTIDRAYFGAESKLSDYTSLRITFDIRPERFSTSETNVVDSDGDTLRIPAMTAYGGYPIILKYAYADWKIKPMARYLKVRLGLQPTMYLNYMDGAWNRRYVEKNIGDIFGWLSTADLGLSFIYTLGPQGNLGEAGLSILNGTKYSDFTDKNKNKDINLFGKLMPFFNNADFNELAFFGQFYSGTQNKTLDNTAAAADWSKQIISLGGKLAYRKITDLCFDVNFQTLGQGIGEDDLKQSSFSFWSNLYLNPIVPANSLFKTLVLFGRVDMYDPNTDLDDNGNSLVIAGVECAPIKGVRAAINYRTTTFQAAGSTDEKYLYFNTEFKF